MSVSHRLLSGMAEAADRIQAAIRSGEQIAVYGDFDTDGVTASALMYQALRALGARVTVIIPHRTRDGYGLNKTVPQKLLDAGVSLLITVDCGIANAREVADLISVGIDVIVTDHHTPPAELPGCILINPKLPGDPYPFKGLVGCAVAFKLSAALGAPLRGRDLLDLVGLARVADMGELVGENRVLVKVGLRALRESSRPGIVELCKAAGIDQQKLTATDIGFGLGPRLNAAGRIEHAELAYRLLLTQDHAEARQIARVLNDINRERQELTKLQTAQALREAEAAGKTRRSVIVLVGAYNPGIVGLIAGNLARQYHRPAIVLHLKGDGTAAGSARSIPEVNIVDLLREASPLLIRYGGYSAAAGMQLKVEHIPALEAQLNAAAGAAHEATLSIDAELRLSDITWALYDELQLLEPYGHGNPSPVFVAHDVRFMMVRPMGKTMSISAVW
ncbi:MAG: single-stranded-DNA-specific exonuclease RecJ [Chloroflexales bacterium]|nr:single-stranded-DNA-specific exonuclease RecJ [Chloroflexales bacterium]